MACPETEMMLETLASQCSDKGNSKNLLVAAMAPIFEETLLRLRV